MELTSLTQMNLKGFAEELEKLEIKEVEIPKLYIPNWPKAAKRVEIKLGRREFLFPTPISNTGLLRLVPVRKKITFWFHENGKFNVVWSVGWWSLDSDTSFGSDEYNNLERVQAVILFQQFKEELFTKVVQQLRAQLGYHNEVVEVVRQAFEPFIPFVVLDQLSS